METWKEKIRTAGTELRGRTVAELQGRDRLVVEYHRGILGYSREEILVGTDYGLLRIEGTDLCVGCMSRDQLFLSGTICGIRPEGKR